MHFFNKSAQKGTNDVGPRRVVVLYIHIHPNMVAVRSLDHPHGEDAGWGNQMTHLSAAKKRIKQFLLR